MNKKYVIGLICAFTIELLLSGGVVKAVGELLASNIVYDNSTSGLTSTDVQSAINVINTKANRKITGDGSVSCY